MTLVHCAVCYSIEEEAEVDEEAAGVAAKNVSPPPMVLLKANLHANIRGNLWKRDPVAARPFATGEGVNINVNTLQIAGIPFH